MAWGSAANGVFFRFCPDFSLSPEFEARDPVNPINLHFGFFFTVHANCFEHDVHTVLFCDFHSFSVRFRDIEIYGFSRNGGFQGSEYFFLQCPGRWQKEDRSYILPCICG